MPTGRQGSIHLFRLAGIDVFLHWSWFLVAAFEINSRAGRYTSVSWNICEYLALFLIVLMHEFGHALSCRQVGGQSNRIVLWPLGGVAYVDPPPRPGATLWSIAAGPLVNVALMPVLWMVWREALQSGWALTMPNAYLLVRSILIINVALLAFNILPIYPLDGGQILRAFLWFFLGRARSLMVATVLGFIGVAGLIFFAVRSGSLWIGVLSIFILMNCWGGLKQALALLKLAKLPRRQGYACPWCGSAPPIGSFWTCNQCRTIFDTFGTHATCPHCAATFPVTVCVDCHKPNPINDWVVSDFAPSQTVIGSSPHIV